MQYTEAITKLAEEGKISQETMIKLAAFQTELQKLAASDPMQMQKWLQYLLAGIGLSLGIGAVGAGAKVGVKAYEKYRLEEEKPEMFEKILAEHPDLRKERVLAEKYFNSLVHFSPVIAKDPLAAGAYIRQAMLMHDVAGGPLPDMVQRLADINQRHNQSRKDAGATTLGDIVSPIGDSAFHMIPTFNINDVNL